MTTVQLQKWLCENLSQETAQEVEVADEDSQFTDFNLDSLSVVSLAYELETYTGLAIDPTVFSEFDTPNKLVQWIMAQAK